MTRDVAISNRQMLKLGTLGLSPKEETLLKSFVRLLTHRTAHEWVVGPGTPDVLVVPQGRAPSDPTLADRTLVLGLAPQSELHFVRVPFHADELEKALNSVGTAALNARVGQEASGDAPCSLYVRLLRWPPAELLNSADRMKLATLMTGRLVAVGTLAERSGIQPAVCSAFVNELQQRGLLHTMRASPTRQALPAVVTRSLPATPVGLLHRIRDRLAKIAS